MPILKEISIANSEKGKNLNEQSQESIIVHTFYPTVRILSSNIQ